MSTVKEFSSPPVSEREILRYAKSREGDAQTVALMQSCLEEAMPILCYRVCFRESGLDIDGSVCRFDGFSVSSSSLAKNLEGCGRVLIFAATLGVGLDRLIAKYGRIAPSRALLFQAIGAERIEALCDAFCSDIEKEKGIKLRSRFSAGYGDVPLDCQRDIFAVLDCPRKIGLSLNDSMLMSPSKSVTAFVGIGEGEPRDEKCKACENDACSFRR